jgi:hypothetical protein
VAWHSVLLKHPGGVPAAAGVAGWFAGLFGDPGKWHCAQTGAFAGSVVVWVYAVPAEARHGLGACGALTPWQVKQETSAPPPEKLLPWQIWQEANPELPGAFFASAPWAAGVAQFATGSWWHPAGLPKQETPEIPPARSEPWHSVQELVPPLAM